MNGKRDEAATVGISLRLREGLRQNLEDAARAKRTSLNQEVIERCELVRDRHNLLMETMALAFGSRELAAILMLVGAVMTVTGRSGAGTDWTADPVAYGEAVREANRALEALRPEGDTPLGSVDRMVWTRALYMLQLFVGSNLPERIISVVTQVESQLDERKKPQK